jgi:hypothetical protein
VTCWRASRARADRNDGHSQRGRLAWTFAATCGRDGRGVLANEIPMTALSGSLDTGQNRLRLTGYTATRAFQRRTTTWLEKPAAIRKSRAGFDPCRSTGHPCRSTRPSAECPIGTRRNPKSAPGFSQCRGSTECRVPHRAGFDAPLKAQRGAANPARTWGTRYQARRLRQWHSNCYMDPDPSSSAEGSLWAACQRHAEGALPKPSGETHDQRVE